MIEDNLFTTTIDLTAIVAEALGETRSAIPQKQAWYRLLTQLQFFAQCLHYLPPGTQVYLIRTSGVLLLIEKVRYVIPYTITINGEIREAQASTPIYFTDQPAVAGKTIEECLR